MGKYPKTLHLYLATQGLVDRRHHAIYDIINVGVVSRSVAIAILLDGDAVENTLDELERRHVRSAVGPVYGEKAQSSAVQAVQMVECVGKQLAVITEEYKKRRNESEYDLL